MWIASGDRRDNDTNDEGNDSNASRVDSRAVQRAEATKRFSIVQNPMAAFHQARSKFWKSCIDIWREFEIAMLENDSTH